jgi:hypothetical protein
MEWAIVTKCCTVRVRQTYVNWQVVCYLVRISLQSRPLSRSWKLCGTVTATLCSRCRGVAVGASQCGCSPSRTSRAAIPPRGRRGGAHRVFSPCPQFRLSIWMTQHKTMPPSGPPLHLQARSYSSDFETAETKIRRGTLFGVLRSADLGTMYRNSN